MLLNYITAACTLIATITAVAGTIVALRTFAHQRTANDISLAMQVFSEINQYWSRISELDPKDIKYIDKYEYNMGQILTYFEISCAMFNKKILTKDASDVLSDHIIEVFSQLESTDNGMRLISKCVSSDETFCELKKFAKCNFPKALKASTFGQKL